MRGSFGTEEFLDVDSLLYPSSDLLAAVTTEAVLPASPEKV